MTGRLAMLGALAAVLGCAPEAAHSPAEEPPPPVDDAAAELPAALADPARPPDAELLLPPLDGYETDDRADPGELEASFDHGSVPYLDVRRRLILDTAGFTRGEVTVVIVPPDRDGTERVLDHRYGAAPRMPERVAGQEVLRIDTDPFPTIAWAGPTWVVTFARGADSTDSWLYELAEATLRAVIAQARQPM